jgi:hypothetical protein
VARLIRHPIYYFFYHQKGRLGRLEGVEAKDGFTALHVLVVERLSIPDLPCGAREEPCLFFLLSTQHFILVEGIRIGDSYIV